MAEDTNPIGSASQWAWGFEKSRGVPDFDTVFGIAIEKENFGTRRTEDENRNLGAGNWELEGVRVKGDIGGSLDKQPDVNSIVRLRTHFHGHTEITELVEDEVYEWEVREPNDDDDPLPHAVDTIFALPYRDDGYEEVHTGGMSDTTTIEITRNAIIDFSMGIIFSHETHLDAPEADAGNTGDYAGELVVRGSSSDETSTDELIVECTTAGPLGEAGFKCTIGATPLGGAETEIFPKPGVWEEFLLPDGSYEGADYPAEKVEFMFTAAAGEFDAGDRWIIAQRRDKTTVVVPTGKPLTAVGARLLIDGELMELESATIEMERPRLAYHAVGSAFAPRVINNGRRRARVTFDKIYLDRTFLRRLKAATKVSFLARMRGDRIGDTPYFYAWDIEMPNVKFREAGTDGISGPEALRERVALYAFFDSDTGSAPVIERFVTTVPVLV